MYIDAHCHLFHKGYLNRRILKELTQLTNALDRWVHREKHGNDANDAHKLGVKSLLRRTHNVISLILSESSLEVLRRLKHHYHPHRFIYVPLSYDLISCFQEAYDQNLDKLSLVRDTDLMRDLRDKLKIYLRKHFTWLKRYGFLKDLLELYFNIEDLEHKQPDNPEHKTNIYLRQLNELLELKKRYPNLIYPFFYFDPRRPGLLEKLKDLTGPGKPFLGVKLYTPNGYSPLDPNLMQVYEYCEKNGIPITVHNAYGGFSNFVRRLEVKGAIYLDGQIEEVNGFIEFDYDFFAHPDAAIKERAEKLNHPRLWEQVLNRFPGLRLNLAHFGGDSLQWQQEIFSLITSEKYPNLYTDLSCQTEPAMLRHIKRKYFDNRLMQQRFLYGSDFYLNMFFIDTFDRYYANFRSVFTPQEFQIIARHNPQRFLQLPLNYV